MFTIRRSSNFNACYLGHADCSSFNTPTPHFPKSYYMKGTVGTYDDRTQQVLTLSHPEGACLIYTTPYMTIFHLWNVVMLSVNPPRIRRDVTA